MRRPCSSRPRSAPRSRRCTPSSPRPRHDRDPLRRGPHPHRHRRRGDLRTLTRSDPKEFLFFERDAAGKAAGKAFIGRLQERTTDRDADISPRAFITQLRAIQRFGRSAPSDLGAVTQPTLIANGDHDRMVPSVLSHDLHRRIAGSELVIYPGSDHGAIFQFHQQFAQRAVDFLGR